MSDTVDVTFELRPAHARLHDCTDAEVCAVGMAGSGKTLAACLKLHLMALEYPGMVGMLGRATQVSLAATTLQTMQRRVLPEALASGMVRWYGGSQKDPAAFIYENGSRILAAGADNPQKILSLELDLCYIDEAVEITQEFYETLLTRLRGATDVPYRQVILGTNPSHPGHWIKRRAEEGKLRIITSTHRDNPAYTREDGSLTREGRDYMAKLDALTGTRRDRLRDGRWIAAEGVIYGTFSEDVHVVQRSAVPTGGPVYLVIDWGHTNPAVVQWWTLDYDGRLYLYRELYHTGVLVEDLARQVRTIIDDHPEEAHPTDVIADHDAGDRATFEKHSGLTTTAADKRVTVGLEAVQARLRLATDNRPRLYVVRGARLEEDESLAKAGKPTSTQEEFGGYVWDTRPGAVAERETPLKKNDHGMDALRYLVVHLDVKSEVSVQSPARGRGAARTTATANRYARTVHASHAK